MFLITYTIVLRMIKENNVLRYFSLSDDIFLINHNYPHHIKELNFKD
jgi:hypothetical protein